MADKKPRGKSSLDCSGGRNEPTVSPISSPEMLRRGSHGSVSSISEAIGTSNDVMAEQRGRRMSSKAAARGSSSASSAAQLPLQSSGTLKRAKAVQPAGTNSSTSSVASSAYNASNASSEASVGSNIGSNTQAPVSPVLTYTSRQKPLADIFDSFEKEQEAMVNKLQREISQLKNERSRSRSLSTSSSSSISRATSVRSTKSIYSDSDDINASVQQGPTGRQRNSFSGACDDNGSLQALRRENEMLKKKLAALSIKCE